MLRTLFSCGIASIFLTAPGLAADVYVCPWWMWGQTGNICHYYSQYHEADGPGCTSVTWGNYDGDFNTPMYGNCPDTSGGCLGPVTRHQLPLDPSLALVLFQAEGAPAAQVAPAPAAPGAVKKHGAAGELRTKGYDFTAGGGTLLRGNIKPKLRDKATLKNGDGDIVRVRRAGLGGGVFFAKLFHIQLEVPAVPGLPPNATPADVYYGVQIESQPGPPPATYDGTVLDTALYSIEAPDENGDLQTYQIYLP